MSAPPRRPPPPPGVRRAARDTDAARLPDHANAGLVAERVGGVCVTEAGRFIEKKLKVEWYKPVADREHGDLTGLAAQAERQRRLVVSRAGLEGSGLVFRAATSSRLAIGLGIAGPAENGLSWHHTLGAPFIPGSSLKGMVQAYAEEFAGAFDLDDQVEARRAATRIFGQFRPDWQNPAHDKDRDTRLGSVIFLDALPLGRVKVVLDVMTPHSGDWHKGASTYPNEASEVSPVQFPVVDAGACFQFAVAPSDGFRSPQAGADDADDLADQRLKDCFQVVAWMKAALEIIGVGAKTKAGYGRLKAS